MDRIQQLLLVLIIQVMCICHGHRTCQHGNEPAQVIHKVPLEPKHHLLKRALDQPIRIREFYDMTVNSLTQSFQDLIKNNVVPKLIEFLSMALQVRRTEVPILLSRGCIGGTEYIVANSTYRHCNNGCFAKTMCGSFVIPEEHLQRCCQNATVSACDSLGSDGPGVEDADFVLYVSANNSGSCMDASGTGGELIAFATHCQQEAALDRPIAGSVNLCPDAIQGSDIEKVIATVKHELLHAMGFSSSLYAFFHDEDQMPRTERGDNGLPLNRLPNGDEYLLTRLTKNGNRLIKMVEHQYLFTFKMSNTLQEVYQPDSSTLRTITRNDWMVRSGFISRTIVMIVTPAVQREARSHFGCDTLEGAEIENQGGSGTAGSHWEKRLFQNEAMTGIFTENPVFSRITLALLEDSGWYRVNYTMAETLVWGRNLGCDFVFTSCRSWLLNQIANQETLEPFCNIPRRTDGGTTTDCTYDHLSMGICNLVPFLSDLDIEYQYFDMETLPSDVNDAILSNASRYGSSVQIADFCPFVQQLVFTSGGVVQRETECFNSSNQKSVSQNIGGELYGPNSRCFLQGGPWRLSTSESIITANVFGSGCYEYTCTESGLKFNVQGKEFTCSCKGETVMINVTFDGRRYQGSIICPACADVCWDEPSICPSPEPPACFNQITFTNSTTITIPPTTSTNPGTNPTNPGTNPTNPGTNPTNPGTNPTNPGTNPTTTTTDSAGGGCCKLHGSLLQAILITTLVFMLL